MAARKNARSGSGSKSKKKESSSSNGRSSSSRKRKHDEFDDYEIIDPSEIDEGPDAMLVVPVVKVEEIDVEVDDLRAAVSLRAHLQDLVQLNVGVAARLGKVELNIQGVEAQALLKVRLDNVSAILARVLTSLDRNPKLLESVGKSVEQVSGGAQETLESVGETAEEVGEGGKSAVEDVGDGAGQAAGQIGEGAGKAAGEVGQGAGQAVKGVGQGGGQAAKGVTGQGGG
jgi:methyl-accepting chemotaxis protein